jgi:hypothetical protein
MLHPCKSIQPVPRFLDWIGDKGTYTITSFFVINKPLSYNFLFRHPWIDCIPGILSTHEPALDRARHRSTSPLDQHLPSIELNNREACHRSTQPSNFRKSFIGSVQWPTALAPTHIYSFSHIHTYIDVYIHSPTYMGGSGSEGKRLCAWWMEMIYRTSIPRRPPRSHCPLLFLQNLWWDRLMTHGALHWQKNELICHFPG